ncbi:MAG TPA: hypothetical protein VFC57_07235 [Aeromicrobium sp.]|nr:hypothetical protein [Aeromicrobium sp.]
MNTVTITNNNLVVEPQGLNKLWSFKRRLEIPLSNVRGATFDPGANSEPKGLRAPGLAIPGKWAGTFHRDGEKSFWNVSKAGETVVIELADEHYDRLILTVNDPRVLVDRINAAILDA